MSLPKSSPPQPSDNGCPHQQGKAKTLELPMRGLLVILLRGRKITSYLVGRLAITGYDYGLVASPGRTVQNLRGELTKLFQLWRRDFSADILQI